MATLEIKKETGGYFRFTLDGDLVNSIIDNAPNLTSFGNSLNFKTKNGANIIKRQFIQYNEVSYYDVSDTLFTFGSVDALWIKLISEGFFDGLGTGGGGSGVDRFDNLLDTFDYIGNDGKVPVVDQSQLKLVPTVFYNFKDFIQLEDVAISNLIENKILSVQLVSGVPKIVLTDAPADPIQLVNAIGFVDYNDLATHTTPLTLVTNVPKQLTNDTLGTFTLLDYAPFGVTSIWNSTTNSFDFNELSLGDSIDIRFDVNVTTTTANQRVKAFLRIGEGSVGQYDLTFLDSTFKTAGTHPIVRIIKIYIGSEIYRTNPSTFYVETDASGTCIVNGWYNQIFRKSVNVLDINIEEDPTADHYKGLWNASTNTPTLANGIGQVGDYYKVSISGTQFSTLYNIGDIISFDGLFWYKMVNNSQSSATLVTRKTATSTNLTTQDIAGFLTYVNGITAFAIAANEHVIYEVTDTRQAFLIYPNNRSVGSGQPALTSSEVLEIEKNFTSIKRNDFSILTHHTQFQPSRLVELAGPLLTTTGTADDSGTGPSYAGNSFLRWVRRRYVSAGAAGSNVSHSTGAYRMIDNTSSGQFFCSTHVGNEDASAVATGRTFFGFYGSFSFPNVNPSTASDLFGLSNDSTDTNMQIIHNDSSGSATKIDLGASFPANTVSVDHYLFQFWKYAGSTEIHYYVKNIGNGAEVKGKVTTNLPVSGYYTVILNRNNGSTASAVRLSASHLIISENK